MTIFDEVNPSSSPMLLRTQRLRLRSWREEDRVPFARLNGDPRVMRHYPSTLSRDESDAIVDRVEAHFAGHGYGLWAVEVPDVSAFIGFIGLQNVRFDAPFTPAVEIGWRLASAHWNKGYATEGARAAVDYAFGELGLGEVVSFTPPGNGPSRRVMEKLGMTHYPSLDFDHPDVPSESPLRRHVFYRLTRAAHRSGPA